MVQVEIVAALIGLIGTASLGGVGWLIKEVRGWRKDMYREHMIVVNWLSRITDSLNEEGFDVKKPDEVTSSIEVGEE